jgi:hypothetical protein
MNGSSANSRTLPLQEMQTSFSLFVSDLASLAGRRDSDARLPELTNEFFDSRVRAHSELFFSRASGALESLDSDEQSSERVRE